MLIPKYLYGIIGWPLGQTLSPLIHNTGFTELRLPSVYMAWPVPPNDLKSFMVSLRLLKIQGCSVTIPHKIAILRYLDNISEPAALAGAVNTLYWRNDELYGENTDVAGFMTPVARLELASMDILMLGAGGAARAVASGLRLGGCQRVSVASPGNQSQYQLCERFAFTPIPWQERYVNPAQLVINATPIGMTGELVNESPYDFAKAPAVNSGYAYDLVYNPLQTRFLKEAAAVGRQCISGLEMFFEQGNAQFKLWTGQSLPEKSRIVLAETLGAEA